MLPDVQVVTHRPELKARLDQLLDACSHRDNGRCVRPADPSEAFSCPARVVIVDVVSLFPSPDNAVATFVLAGSPEIVVVGYLEDTDAILSAFNEEIPVYVLEQLTAEILADVLGRDGVRPSLYVQYGRVCAQRLARYLHKRRAQQLLTRRQAQILDLLENGNNGPGIASELGIAH